MLPIRQLRPGFLCADSKKGAWEWAFVWIEGILGLTALCGGILLIFGAVGFFPDRDSGWGVGTPGIAGVVFGVWLILCAVRSAQGFIRLIIDGKRVVLQYVFRGRNKCIAEGELCSGDHLMCHLREDAEQDLFAVSTELELVKLGTSITLFLNGVECAPTPGQTVEDALNDGFRTAAKRAFDKAQEIGNSLNIRVHY